MLRDANVSSERPSVWRRCTVVAITLAAGLLVAGVRRPGIGVAVATQPATNLAVTQSTGFNTENVPASTVVLIGAHPAQLAERPEMQPVVNLIEEALEAERSGMKLEDIDQYLLMAGRSGDAEVSGPEDHVMELRMKGPTSFDDFIHVNIGTTTKQEVDGQDLRANGDIKKFPTAQVAWVVDKRTLVWGRARNVLGLLKSKRLAKPAPEWLESFQSKDGAQLACAIDIEFIRPTAQAAFTRNPNPMTGMVSPLWQNIEYLIGELNLDEEATFSLYNKAADADAAMRIADTYKLLLPVAKGLLAGANASRQNTPVDMRAIVSLASQSAAQALDTARVVKMDDHVRVTMSAESSGVVSNLSLLIPVAQAARTSARRVQSRNNLKHIGLALHNYHDAHKSFPPAVLFGPDGRTKHSWRVAILPYIERKDLYDAYNLNELWDSPNNLKVLAQIPDIYRHPEDLPDSTNTSYFGVFGKGTVFGDTPGVGTKIREILDGTSNTLMVCAARHDVPWTKPQDLPYSSDGPIPELGGFDTSGFLGLTADGAVHFFAESLAEETLRHLITHSDSVNITF